MGDTGLAGLSLTEVAAGVAARQLSPVEVTAALLARIEATDSVLNSYIEVHAESARGAAEAAERAITAGYYLGPLHGVPVALKDNVATRGEETRAGSAVLRGNVPDADATIAARLRSAGAILIGKLNMHEFAYGVTTNNPHYGAARNPWNTDCTPGGSSGGSGAAVAGRLAYGAIGTDTGCSVRLPATFNGITGLRPSIGRVSNHGIVPLAWTLDTAGPMCRTVRDCATMLEAIAGHDSRDRQTVNLPVPHYDEELGRGVDGLRIAVIEDFSLTGVQPDVEAAVRTALSRFEDGGAVVREVRVPDLEQSISALLTIDIAEPSAYHGAWLRERAGDYGDDVRSLLEAGELYLATHYIQAQRYRTVLSDHFASVLRDAEVVVTPTVPFTAPPVGATEVQMESGEQLDIITAVMRYNALPPLTGMPAMSVPCGFSNDGMPIGMQIIGRGFDEATVFRVGHAYQQMTDWHLREPALSSRLADTDERSRS
jgi:aspartyl-tRNA(Asn)/glutamyl-tRNA(Gln) amidotransferase subunit A